jgi:iron-sulfur cluster assembly protein/iron-sulfur cluster insertion protein
VSTTQETTTTINLTDAAAAKVAELVKQEGNPELALRVAVRPGGCSGYSYEMFFDSEFADDDLVSVFGDVKVVVDPTSLPLIMGATLDFKVRVRQRDDELNTWLAEGYARAFRTRRKRCRTPSSGRGGFGPPARRAKGSSPGCTGWWVPGGRVKGSCESGGNAGPGVMRVRGSCESCGPRRR